MNISKPRRRSPVARAHRLHRLPLAAIRSAPQNPLVSPAIRIARIPELGGNSAVARILQYARFLSALNLPTDLSRKLKLIPPVIDRPRTIRLHKNTVVRVRNQIVRLPTPWQQADVGHTNNRQAVPALRSHRSRRTLQTHQMRRLAIRQIPAKLTGLDDVSALRRN